MAKKLKKSPVVSRKSLDKAEAMVKLQARIISYLIEELDGATEACVPGHEGTRSIRIHKDALANTADLGWAFEGDSVLLALGDPRE